MLTVTLSYEEWCHHVPDPSVWRHTEYMSCAVPLWNTGPAFLLLFLLHSHVPRCGIDIICSLKPSPTEWGIISGPCLHPLSGHAFYSTCSAKHPIPHEVTTLHCPLPHQHQSVQFLALCFHVNHSYRWVESSVETRNEPYSVLNPNLVLILRGLRTYTRDWMTCVN